MRPYSWAAYRDGKIISLHYSHRAAEKAAGKKGQVLYPALGTGKPEFYTDKNGIDHQVFLAPDETGHRCISLNGLIDPIY